MRTPTPIISHLISRLQTERDDFVRRGLEETIRGHFSALTPEVGSLCFRAACENLLAHGSLAAICAEVGYAEHRVLRSVNGLPASRYEAALREALPKSLKACAAAFARAAAEAITPGRRAA